MDSASAQVRRVEANNRDAGSQPLHQGDGDLSLQTGQHSSQTTIRQRNVYHNLYMGMCQQASLNPGLQVEALEITWTVIIDWLAPLSFGEEQVRYHKSVLSQRTPGTGEWVLPFIDMWKKEPGTTLWLHGDLGSGKTVMSSFIINTIEQEIENSQAEMACIYTYCQDAPILLERLVIDLLRQLIQSQRSRTPCREIIQKYNSWRLQRKFLTTIDYVELIKAVAKGFSDVYLIIDGLEDFSYVEEGTAVMEDILRLVDDLSSSDTLRALITSRSASSTEYDLRCVRGVQVTPKREDLEAYILSRARNDKAIRERMDQSRYEKTVVSKVAAEAQGMFLMTKLQMDHLSQRAVFAPLELALDQLPKSVPSAFRASIERIKDKDSRTEGFPSLAALAKHVLASVTHALAPLTAEQVSLAFALLHSQENNQLDCIPDRRRLVSVCAGLVTRDPATGDLRLVHESIRKHLKHEGIMLERPHTAFARVCIKCLSLDDRPELLESGLMAYCATHWMTHYDLAKQEGPRDQLRTMALQLLSDSGKAARILQLGVGKMGHGLAGMTGLHAASYYGKRSWANTFLKKGVNINSRCSDGQTALHWAAKYGRHSVIRLLVKEKALLDVKDEHGDTPLHAAFSSPSTNFAQTVKELVVGGASLDMRGARGWTPLYRAMRYGPTKLTQLFVSHQRDVNVEDSEGWTSLRHAMSEGKLKIALYLLDRGADPNQPSSRDSWTPLRWAVQGGDLAMVERLIKYGADVNARDEQEGLSALRWAIYYNYLSIVNLLIRHKASVGDKAKDGLTPLLAAIVCENKVEDKEKLVWTLLQNGASPDDQDGNGETPLHHAVQASYLNLGWLLVTRKARLGLKDHQGLTALAWAVELGSLSFCWLLCENGARADLAGNDGITPFHRAAGQGHVHILGYFIDRGDVDINHADQRGSSAMDHASRQGKTDVMKLLVSKGASTYTSSRYQHLGY